MRNFWFAVQKEGCGAHRSGLELDVVQHGVFSRGRVSATSSRLQLKVRHYTFLVGTHQVKNQDRF